MVRVLIIALFCSILFADSKDLSAIDLKIINLVGESSYNRNRSFINKLFANKNSFYQNGYLNIYEVISTLQNNGLLKLKFDKPQDFNVVFSAKTSPIFLLRAVNQSLLNMGYSYWLPSEVNYEEDTATIKITLNTEHIIDPLILLNELAKSGFASANVIQNSQTSWEYDLILLDSKIPNSTFISKGNSVNVYEVSGQYWLEVGSTGTLEVSSLTNIEFNPKIVFFDKNLNILDVEELSKRNRFSINIVDNTKFVSIKDYVYSANLKSGLNVKLK